MTAVDLHGPLPSGHPKLLAAGRTLEDLILLALLTSCQLLLPLTPKDGCLLQEPLILQAALGYVAGEGPEDIHAHSQNKYIIKESSCASAL